MRSSEATVPLVARAATDVLFCSVDQVLTTKAFLWDVHHLAEELPDASHLFNLCKDRYFFMVSLAAAAMRGQICLLTSDQSASRLTSLAERFADVKVVTDDSTFVSPLPCHYIRSRPTRCAGSVQTPYLPVDRLTAIVFTSGSTGEPVGSWKFWGPLAERSIACGNRFGFTGERPTSVIGMVPPRHMYGFETTGLLPLHAACSSWCGPLFYPSDVRAALTAVPAPRVLVTTPLQLRALLQAELELPEVASIISATAPLDPTMAAAAEARWSTEVFEIFGATELGSIASRRTVLEENWTTYDGITLEHSKGEPVRVMATHLLERMSDIVEVLEPTQFRLIGRNNDMIKLGGRRASLSGLNRVLTDIPGVADGVFVAPDDLDNRPTARMQAFVIAPNCAVEDILAELRNRIDPVFLPRRVTQVTTLPRNEVGKLPHDALLAMRAEKGEDD